MALLLLFAFVAGAGTALSPCVLPILPGAALGRRDRRAAAAAGDRARARDTFTITIAGCAELVDGVGLGDGTLRSLAVVVLLGFGLLLLAPPLADRARGRALAPAARSARAQAATAS